LFIQTLFEKSADIFKDATAVSLGTHALTYSELDNLANKIAHALIADGVIPGDVVGVNVKRSPELIATVLGILKAGATFLPQNALHETKALKIISNETLAQMNLDAMSAHRVNLNLSRISSKEKALVEWILWQQEITPLKKNGLVHQTSELKDESDFEEIFLALTNGAHVSMISEERRGATQELLNKQLLYWEEKLKALPVLDLPIDYKRPLQNSFAGSAFPFNLTITETNQLREIAQKHEVSLFNIFLTAFKLTLARYSGLDDIIVGLPVANNVVALRTHIDLNQTLKETLKNISSTCLEAFSNQLVSFHTILSKTRTPVFQTLFSFQHEKIETTSHTSTDLELWVELTEGEIRGFFKFRKDLFKEITIERFAESFLHVLEKLNENFDKPQRDVKFIPPEHLDLIIKKWNDTWTDTNHLTFTHKLFEENARKFPEVVAVDTTARQMTYGQLDKLANRCANALIEKGVKRGDLVGISLSRDTHLLVAILGVLKAGAGYVPLDPAFPQDRLDYMLSSSTPKVLITEEFLAIRFKPHQEKILISKVLDEARFDGSLPQIHHELTDTMYVIYTSGSTGNPKGVQVTHTSVSNLLWAMKEKFHFTRTDKLLAVTTLSFDIATSELLLPLTAGGTVYLATNEEAKDGDLLKNILDTKNITMIQTTASMLRLLLASSWKPHKNFRALSGGETFPLDLAHTLIPMCREVWNMYGPTETTIISSGKKLSLSDEFITIGKPIANTTFYILDENKEMKPIGATGELFIGGLGLAKGYFGREDLTRERFLPDPFIPGARMYATGDLARFTYDGEVEYMGRNDGQVKVRGYRIELSEIELTMTKQVEIESSVVRVITEDDDMFICAYYVGNPDIKKLRNALRNDLPEYMIPNFFIKLESIPLTLSGKIDYRSLPLPTHTRPDLTVNFSPAETSAELMVEKIWKKHIRIQNIGIDDNFFDLGGTSLMAIKLLVDINQVSPKKLSVVHLFQYTTIRQIAAFLENEKDELDGFLKIHESSHVLSGDIAVIGMTGRFPGAENVDEFWENLIAIKNTIELFDPKDVNPLISKELTTDSNYVFAHGAYPKQKSFDYKYFGMTPLEAELMDPQHRKFLELTHEVLELAGYDAEKFKGPIGIFAGMVTSKYGHLVSQYPEKVKTLGDFNVSLGLEKDYLATKIAFKLNLKGPALSINTACSTSLVAIIEAVKSLRTKNCDMALAGGISIIGAPHSGHLFFEGGIFSKNGECHSFDKEATGTVFTDGGGVVVLKRLSDAERDGDNILGVIKGVGINNDGANKMSFTAPSVLGQAEAILLAQKDAGIEADTIGFIEAHGTATPVGDPIEVEALTKAFRKSTGQKNFCYLGSVKSNVGHLNSAAGVASFIKAIKVLNTGIIPGTAHFKAPNELLDLEHSPFIIAQKTTDFPANYSKRRIGISSFGVGGTNAHVVVEEYKKVDHISNLDEDLPHPSIFKISAKSEPQLALMKEDLIKFLKNSPIEDWKKIAYTLEIGRKEHKYRSFVAVESHSDLERLTKLNSGNGEFSKVPTLYFMFPGQGSHYKEMGHGLYQVNPIFRETFDQCCEILNKHLTYNIKDIIFNEKSQEDLNNTFYSQPAIFMIQYSLAMTLKWMGINPIAYIGHSIGEFVAATLNEVFSLEDGLRAIAKRAEIMTSLPEGMMLSVSASENDLIKLIGERELDIAAVNGQKSCVVAGKKADIVSFKTLLADHDVAAIELKTSHAFHSRMMKPAVDAFLQFLKTITISKPLQPMYSTVTTHVESELFSTPEYWANHIVETVQFSKTISKILSLPNILLLEVGTKNILSQLAKKEMTYIPDCQAKVINLLSDQSILETQSFTKAIGDLWINGIKTSDPAVLFAEKDRKRVIAPVYIFEANEVWLEPKTHTTTPILTVKNKDQPMNSELTSLEHTIAKLFEKSSGNELEAADYGTSFLEMGMDSLFLSQFSLLIKKELKVSVTFRQLMEDYGSINLLAKFLLDKVEVKKPATIAPTPVVSNAPMNMPMPTLQGVESSPGLEVIINRQLELMSQQIMLLKGSSPITTSMPALEKTVKAKVKVNNVKEAFGAQARITTEKASLSPAQLKEIQNFIEKYVAKTKSSKKFAQDNRKNHADPRAVTGFKPESKEIVYPLVVHKSKLQTLWDIDGNKYIDMTCGFGSNFFGNGNEKIKKHVLKQIEDGIEIGPQHPLVAEVSNMINEMTGNERTAFCSTGSESILGAMRVARTVTGREKIIVFTGSYHGINDEVIIRAAKNGSPNPGAPGINKEAVSNMIVLDYGTDESLQIIREMAHEVAAVLVEPVQSRRCDFQPAEFLREVRKITLESKTCLIFDEIITGFRIHPAGAQGHFGIRADLCTYGKIIGGGMPIGVVSGKAEYMDALDGGFWQYGDESTPTVGVTYFAGTFVRHPLALASAKGALEVLKEVGPAGLQKLNARAQKLAHDLNHVLRTENVPMQVDNFGSLMKPKWNSDILGGDLLFAILRYNGVHVYDGFPWFVNLAHTEEELTEVLNTFKHAIKTMQEMGLFPTGKYKAAATADDIHLDPNIFDQKGAPMVGAKIGRDEKGNPAWFVEDPETGEYFLIKR
jgi:amino acid adenylation domain-containing protein